MESLHLHRNRPSPRAPLSVALEDYQQVLDALNDDPYTLLPVLLARDRVEVTLGQTESLPVESARQQIILAYVEIPAL